MKNFQKLSICLLSLFTFCFINNIQASDFNMCAACGGTCGGKNKELNESSKNIEDVIGKCGCGCKKKPLHQK